MQDGSEPRRSLCDVLTHTPASVHKLDDLPVGSRHAVALREHGRECLSVSRLPLLPSDEHRRPLLFFVVPQLSGMGHLLGHYTSGCPRLV